MHVPKTLTAPAGALLVAALLAGCGGGSDPTGGTTSAPVPPSASVSAGASAAPSATPSPSASASPVAALPTVKAAKLAGSALAATVTAAAKRDRTVKTAVAVTGPLTIEGQGAGQAAGPTLKLDATLTGGKQVAVVRTGDTAYLKLPGATSWYKVDVHGDAGLSATYQSTFSGYEVPQNLAATAAVLKAMGTFTVVGPATVAGLATTRYTVRTTADRASALLPPAYQPVNPTRMKQGRATVSVWVDGQGRLVRTAAVASIPSTKEISLRVTYSGWGGPIDVAAPPAGQVTSL